MDINSLITSISLDRSYYKPGEVVNITVDFDNRDSAETFSHIRLVVTYLNTNIHEETKTVVQAVGFQSTMFTYLPPRETPHGYGIEIEFLGRNNTVLLQGSSAFDVLTNWVQNPRYGFLTNFEPNRTDIASTFSRLNRYHINGLQFYDWMYRHEQFLTSEDPYYDLWSPKPHSIKTVESLIDAAHQYSMAAMPYTAVYGSSRTYALEHPEMVLYTNSGKPYAFGGDKMMIMDPRPDSPWTAHLMQQYREILEKTGFDGIHIDQYGDPKIGYDKEGNRYDLAPVLAEFVNSTKDLVNQYSQNDAVVFNLVTNWPNENIAPTKEDFIYIEVWSPYNWFTDLHQLIVNAQKLGNGKPVVLACYIDPSFENTAILNDAIIFASGGSHIELGENNGMLAEAYFPSYKVISDSLTNILQNYYDFSVRYQDVIGPATVDATTAYQDRITIPDVSTSSARMKDKVWPIVRESKGHTAISLINFLGVEQTDWNTKVPNPPQPLSEFTLSIEGVQNKVADVWFVSADHPSIAKSLPFTLRSDKLTVTVPQLDYWSTIIIDWKN